MTEKITVDGFIANARNSENPPPQYDRPVQYPKMIWDKDVLIPMRDGKNLCGDVMRPDAEGKFPALVACAPHNKDVQTPDIANHSGPQPAWSSVWAGIQEGGDSHFFTSRGYVHIIAQPRGLGKSDDGGDSYWDLYDLIEWAAAQPWCDGKVGMVGVSAFGNSQVQAAALKPPHLVAIYPFDPCGQLCKQGERDFHCSNPGGLFNMSGWFVFGTSTIAHGTVTKPDELPPDLEEAWEKAMKNPDYMMYPNVYNLLTQKGQVHPETFFPLMSPYADDNAVEEGIKRMNSLDIPMVTGSGWYSYTYKLHCNGSQVLYENTGSKDKKLVFAGPAHMQRPMTGLENDQLRWYDYWLKGIENGVMDEPRVRYWVMGANQWRYADDWPLPDTQWTPLYLDSWERLRWEPFAECSYGDQKDPDAFVQMPLTHTNKVSGLRYMTEPLGRDVLIAGPISVKLFASIDQKDTCWIITLKDVGPDPSVHTARKGEREIPDDLYEREITRGWLRASYRELDEEHTTPYRPIHKLTKDSIKDVTPGEVVEYDIMVCSTANLFKAGHRICIDIQSIDVPTGVCAFTDVEYIPYHICSSKTTLHKIYHSTEYPSQVLLPIIPIE